MQEEAQKIANWQGRETFTSTIAILKRFIQLNYVPSTTEKSIDEMYFHAVRCFDNRWLITKSHLWKALTEFSGYEVKEKNGVVYAKYDFFEL